MYRETLPRFFFWPLLCGLAAVTLARHLAFGFDTVRYGIMLMMVAAMGVLNFLCHRGATQHCPRAFSVFLSVGVGLGASLFFPLGWVNVVVGIFVCAALGSGLLDTVDVMMGSEHPSLKHVKWAHVVAAVAVAANVSITSQPCLIPPAIAAAAILLIGITMPKPVAPPKPFDPDQIVC